MENLKHRRRGEAAMSTEPAAPEQASGTTATTSATATPSSQQQQPCYTTDDLIELVRAVKFANPDASIRETHREITEQMSQTPSYEFLKEVKLNEVKKVWKKANNFSAKKHGDTETEQVSAQTSGDVSTSTAGTASSSADSNHGRQQDGSCGADAAVSESGGLQMPPSSMGSVIVAGVKGESQQVLKFYTVGDGTVRTLARDYTHRAAAAAAAKDGDSSRRKEEDGGAAVQAREEELNRYVHVFLDVPADRSGLRPHQALINFNENNGGGGKGKAKGSRAERRSKKRSDSKKKKGGGAGGTIGGAGASSGGVGVEEDGREIVKIQVAAPLGDGTKTPMLLYNADRSARTFIHPPAPAKQTNGTEHAAAMGDVGSHGNSKEDGESRDDNDNDDDGGYDKIRDLIVQGGEGGALGNTGGTKGYFYARITRRKEGQDVISVDVTSGLAPPQTW